VALVALHAPLLRLPYFWDEAGYYVPAARDLLLTGSPVPHSTVSNAHPPLLLMVFMGLHEIGLVGGWPAAVVVIGVGALAAPAAVIAVRALAGEAFARAATLVEEATLEAGRRVLEDG